MSSAGWVQWLYDGELLGQPFQSLGNGQKFCVKDARGGTPGHPPDETHFTAMPPGKGEEIREAVTPVGTEQDRGQP